MRVLVCGGRDYQDANTVGLALASLHTNELRGPITLLIHGGARGADSLAGRWAFDNEVPVSVFFADWNRHGKVAGPIRNQRMIDEMKPELVIAFPGGRGTADMARRAKQAGIDVMEISS